MIYVLIPLIVSFVVLSAFCFFLSSELDRYTKANAKLASENYRKDTEISKLHHKLDAVKNVQNKLNRIKNNIHELNKDLGNLEDVLK